MPTLRLLRSAVGGLALLLASVGLLTFGAAPVAAAVFAVPPGVVGSTPVAGSPVRAVAATAVDRAALTRAFLSARRLPSRAVAGIRPGTLHLASLPSSDTVWAIASFTPSATADESAQAALQDGANTAVFDRVIGQPWGLRAVGGCGRGLPIVVRGALGVSVPATCYAVRSVAPHIDSPGAAAAGRSVGQSIADIALSQVGGAANPVVMNFTGLDCDPYTTLVGPPVPNSNGCGFDTRFGVQNENETWCSDFAKWVWQRAGVTADMNTINAGARSFYAWGLEQGEVLKPDSGRPAVGDAVVFYPPGRVRTATFADHVGIVSSVNRDGTVSLVNGDFIGKTDIDVEYDANVSLTRWASGVWNKGEQWVLVAPPAVAQHPAPSAAITGPGLAVADTSVSFQAHAVEQGGSITEYVWTFGDGGTATGPDASHVFTSAEPQTVTMTATSSFGTVTTSTLNLAVVAPSAATASTASNTVWYLTTPVDQFVFLPTPAGALAADSWNGARWLHTVLPGRADPGSAVTALDYPDGSDVIQPRVFFRSADGHLAQTYRSGAAWATQTLAGRPARGSALVATTAAARASAHLVPDIPEVFYFNQRGRLTQSYEHGARWLTKTLPGPSATNLGSLALADTASDGHPATDVFYIDRGDRLTVASSTDPASPRGRWQSTTIIPADHVSATSKLAAISTGANADQASVFAITTDGKLAAATSGPSSGAWTVSELLGTPAPQSSLLATSYLLPSGALGEDVFYLTASGQPAATSWAANTQQATTLPGTATAILGASNYPAPGQPQRLFLGKGTKITVDNARTPGGLWTATNLPGAGGLAKDVPIAAGGRPR
jgi:PKD repeat protein